MFELEEWRHTGLETLRKFYHVSSIGRVASISKKDGHIRILIGGSLSTRMSSEGYRDLGYRGVGIGKRYTKAGNRISEQFYVHYLVSRAFLGECPNGQQVNHIDGDKNNNHVENLEYVTPSQNMLHAYSLDLCKNRKILRARITQDKVFYQKLHDEPFVRKQAISKLKRVSILLDGTTRRNHMLALRKLGLTLHQVGVIHCGLSRERVRQITWSKSLDS